MLLLLLILGFVVIILIEVPALAGTGNKRDLRAFWVLLALSFLFSFAMVQRWPVPSPTPVLQAIFQPISDLLGLK